MNQSLIKNAMKYCDENKYRLTEPRLNVLKIFASSKKPLGAYEILEKLSTVLTTPKPPTAYRAIEFWQEQGFIHRIESLNAYVACAAGHQHKGSQFMICDACGDVTEAHLCELPQALKKSTSDKTFTPAHWSLEIHGQCRNCA